MAISRQLSFPLDSLPANDPAFIGELLGATLVRADINERMRGHFKQAG